MNTSDIIETPRTNEADSPAGTATPTLRECVLGAMRNYFNQLGGQSVSNLYDMVLAEIEEPLLRIVMGHTKGNQTKAAKLLGLSRGTLRKKLKIYDID